MIAKLEPAVLQDRYLRLYDDHLALKQHARKQEDKIRKLIENKNIFFYCKFFFL